MQEADTQETGGGWAHWIAPVGAGGVALLIYSATAAPGYTWAHAGGDAGDLLAAATTNGVPHPPGYPLYILLLQMALTLAQWLAPAAEPARVGNLLSALCAALAVGLTAQTAQRLLRIHAADREPRHARRGHVSSTVLSAALASGLAAALAFGLTPLLWSQATITEVYALHTLGIAALGALLIQPGPHWIWILILGGGLAHHPTVLLLWPAAFYASWQQNRAADHPHYHPYYKVVLRTWLPILLGAVGLAGLFYLRVPWVAGWGRAAEFVPPPVLWGYPDNGAGLRWLLSGAPYQAFVLGVPWPQIPARLLSALGLLGAQYSVVGALLILWGWNRLRTRAATPVSGLTALLWIVPTLFYAATYNTTDSYIYLLPIVWLMALWLAAGLHGLHTQLAVILSRPRQSRTWTVRVTTGVWLALLLAGGVGLAALRLPAHNLRHDSAAQDYIAAVTATLAQEPAHASPHVGPLLITGTDQHTFALWYAAWSTGELTRAAPGLVLVNLELYAQPWYQRLLLARYPHLDAVGAPLADFVAAHSDGPGENPTALPTALLTVLLTEPFSDRLPGTALPRTAPPGGPLVLWEYVP